MLIFLNSCGDDKRTSVTPVPMASLAQQDRQIAERLKTENAAQELRSAAEAEESDKARLIAALNDPYGRWNALFQKLAGKKATETAEIVAQMRVAVAELSGAPTNACTVPIKAAIAAAMNDVDSAVAEFKSAEGEAKVNALSKRLGEAIAAADDAAASLRKCR